MANVVERVGENSSPEKTSSVFKDSSSDSVDIGSLVYARLIQNGNEEATSNPELRDLLHAHFDRLPTRYGLDVNMDKVEDVLIHQQIIDMAKEDPLCGPVCHIRFVGFCDVPKPEGNDDLEKCTAVPSTTGAGPSTSGVNLNAEMEETMPSKSSDRNVNTEGDFEPSTKLEDLNLDVGKNVEGTEQLHAMENLSRGQEVQYVPIHEIIFSTTDKPKLLSQLSAILSEIGLNICEAHVFSTTDGYSLDIFLVDGWPTTEDTDGLQEAVQQAVRRSEGFWTGSSSSQSVIDNALAALKPAEWEIDRRLLKLGQKIASGPDRDTYRGVYERSDVAVKIIRSNQLNAKLEAEFTQEVIVLSKVCHRNVVRFIGACSKLPQLCIITEYLPGGSLFDYLHLGNNILEPPRLLQFAIDICKGMEYLHQNGIMHRDLKTVNLLLDAENVVKVADFGIAWFLSQSGVMTAETGTYKWMAPEVMNSLPYDQKVDVYSFGIVLWELTTAKVPYHTMTPLQAAVGVKQGLRPERPDNVHPDLWDLMERCWQEYPNNRPSFTEMALELEKLLQKVQGRPPPPS